MSEIWRGFQELLRIMGAVLKGLEEVLVYTFEEMSFVFISLLWPGLYFAFKYIDRWQSDAMYDRDWKPDKRSRLRWVLIAFVITLVVLLFSAPTPY